MEPRWMISMTTPTDVFANQTFRLLRTIKLNRQERITHIRVGDIYIIQEQKLRLVHLAVHSFV